MSPPQYAPRARSEIEDAIAARDMVTPNANFRSKRIISEFCLAEKKKKKVNILIL